MIPLFLSENKGRKGGGAGSGEINGANSLLSKSEAVLRPNSRPSLDRQGPIAESESARVVTAKE